MSTYSTQWGSDTISVTADWGQANCMVEGLSTGQQVADFRHDKERALRDALWECARQEGMPTADAAAAIETALTHAVDEDYALEQEIRTFVADEAQDISLGIYESAISLADCLDAGAVTLIEAREQFAELRSDLSNAKGEASK